ncbi:HMCN1-like protein [Mya arenaria]|uniref:HMCN1-like protein n=1 Tax=Mya arenaria TaxID=6604 RepID=A0ABY7GCA2_MYAAR|nr:HMCN1-like protein [Mya arenaria]
MKPSEDGLTCVDVDECREGPGRCDQICENKFGGFKCSCYPGYRRQGRHGCTDVDECKTGQANCAVGQECVKAVGSYNCIANCPRGFELLNGRCTDTDECRLGQHRCYYNQRCVNTQPGYKCVCPRGYRSAGAGTPCLDIDECTETPEVCAYECENTFGGYECICPPGQIRLADKRSCAGLEFLDKPQIFDINNPQGDAEESENVDPRNVLDDIDECKDDLNICQHNCSNTVGGYECSCPPGYRLSKDKRTCEDINECIEFSINCGVDKMCFNTLGEFTCIDVPCPRNYHRDPITNNCVLECIDAEVACPESARFADVIEFRTLALPSGVLAQQDLIRLTAYNQYDDVLRKTIFTILENDEYIPFQIRLEKGIGIVYTPKVLEDRRLYKIKVLAKSFDNEQVNIQYQTTFMIHISVSSYPY